MMKNYCLLVLVTALVGCATPPDDRNKVSIGLEQRTGLALNEAKPGETSIPPSVRFDDGLSEDEAVTLALWNNAAFLETLADLGLSRADLIQAGMLPNPTFSMLIPVGAKPLELTARYPLEVFWLRPKRVAAAKLDHEKTAQRLVQNGLDLIRDVKLAYTDLTLAEQRIKLLEETRKLAVQIEKLSQARLDAGEVSSLEISTAAIDTMQTEELLTRSRYDAKIARERLLHLIGIPATQWTMGIRQSPAPVRIAYELGLLETNALTARPDLRAAEMSLEAAGKRLGLARTEIFTFAAGINAKEVGRDFLAGPTLDVSLPVVNQNQGGIAIAQANFEKAARHYFTVRDRILLDVREAHTRLVQAQESLIAWRERILPPLENTVSQAQKAYASGDISFLLVLEASRKLADIRVKEAMVLGDICRATAELERSIGGKLPATGNSTPAN